jgi:small subunit ribosomal protein S17
MPKRTLVGEVTSIVDANTAVIEVVRVKSHALYKKVIRLKKKYMAHVMPEQKVILGQTVEIEESKPISKLKKWIVK